MTKWISIEDRPPENGTEVVVKCESSDVKKMFTWNNGKWCLWDGDPLPEYITKDITHWQPLPD